MIKRQFRLIHGLCVVAYQLIQPLRYVIHVTVLQLVGWFQTWKQALAIREITDLVYSVATWFAGGGDYHAYYMLHGENHYGRTASSAITTWYADDVCLHAEGILLLICLLIQFNGNYGQNLRK